MSEKIKISLVKIIQTKAILFGLILISVGLLLPLRPALAVEIPLVSWLGDIGGGMATAIVTTALQIPLFFANAFLGIAATLLGWVVSPNFVSISYTRMDNPLIAVGWPLTRDLANMGFVIALILIGLGTALRRGEYQVQKTLPTLIIIALLINFTPVILGVIIDASNILMNFFLEGVTGGETFYKVFAQQFAIFQNAWGGWSSGLNLAPVSQTLVLIFFAIMAGFMLFAFALLFIIRYIAIWTLVILSPLAFFCYVLPATRKFWSQWWNQFIQWSIVGIFAAFFLYLSDQMMQGIVSKKIVFNTTPGNVTGGMLDTILPYTAVIVLMFVGLFMALTSSAMGAGGVISMSQKGARSTGKWLQGKGAMQSRALARRMGESKVGQRVLSSAQRLQSVQAGIPAWGLADKGPKRWFKRGMAGVVGSVPLAAGELARSTGRLSGQFLESGKKKIAAAEKEVENAAVELVISKFRSATDWATKIGYLNRLSKKGDLDEAMEKGLGVAKDIAPTYEKAKQYDSHKDILSALPNLEKAKMAAIAGVNPGRSTGEAYAGKIIDPTTGKPVADSGIISGIKTSRAGQVSRLALSDPDILDAIVLSWDGQHIAKLIESTGVQGIEAIEKSIETNATRAGVDVATWLQSVNKPLYKYLTGNAARNLGFSIFP